MAPASAVASKGAKQDDAQARQFWPLALGAVGVVYGDIGTSPIYAFREAVVAATGEAAVAHDTVLGILSLIVWSLFLLVTLKYVFVLLRADFNGEGGTFALMALAQSVAQRSKHVILLLGIAGASFLYGDAAITPALSVISAVEGLKVIAPAFEKAVVPLSIAILIGLFAMQSRGTAKVAALFGPIILLWFAVLAVIGVDLHRRGAARARRVQSGPRRHVSPPQWPDRASPCWASCSSPSPAPKLSMPISGTSVASRSRPPGSAWRCPRSPSTTWGRARSCSAARRRSRTPSS